MYNQMIFPDKVCAQKLAIPKEGGYKDQAPSPKALFSPSK